MNHQALSSFIWSVADLLRGDYKQSEYGKVIPSFRADIRAVLTRSLRLYQEGHGGRMPKRLVIHKTMSFK